MLRQRPKENTKCASGSAVEHLLAKEGVAGSIPVSRFFYFIRNLEKIWVSYFFAFAKIGFIFLIKQGILNPKGEL